MPKILIIGTIHLDNPGRDIFNIKVKNIQSPRFQQEILKLVENLRKFSPTKVAVEVSWNKSNLINEKYRKFIDDDYVLSDNEVEQIGFRIAREMGHNQIYAVDSFESFDVEENDVNFDKFARSNGLEGMVEKIYKVGRENTEVENKILEESGYLALLRFLNSEGRIRKEHRIYFEIAKIGKPGDYIGANWVELWYGRNLKIFTNLTWLIEKHEERILLIIGAGHLYLLRRFSEESGFFELEDPLEYLHDRDDFST